MHYVFAICKSLDSALEIQWKHETVPPFKKFVAGEKDLKSKQKRQPNRRSKRPYTAVFQCPDKNMSRSHNSTLTCEGSGEGESFFDLMMYKLYVDPKLQAYTCCYTEENKKSKRETQI